MRWRPPAHRPWAAAGGQRAPGRRAAAGRAPPSGGRPGRTPSPSCGRGRGRGCDACARCCTSRRTRAGPAACRDSYRTRSRRCPPLYPRTPLQVTPRPRPAMHRRCPSPSPRGRSFRSVHSRSGAPTCRSVPPTPGASSSLVCPCSACSSCTVRTPVCMHSSAGSLSCSVRSEHDPSCHPRTSTQRSNRRPRTRRLDSGWYTCMRP
mmetsp:Transcript_15485/g.60550  ORF Transcript_15485/g.60550 Transcript_15485/m.60550 type:complete len:206 (-) Transcript_15485:724-1341(-)